MRLAALLLVALALVACSRETTPTPVTLTQTELDVLLERIHGPSGAGGADPRVRVAEEQLAACMAGAGFEYVPQAAELADDYAVPAVLTRQVAERSGYGDTLPPAPGLVPSRWAFDVTAELAQNEQYRSSLGPEELEAYWTAFEGEDGTTGCLGEVMGEVFADLVLPAELLDAQDALRGAERALEADPRVERAEREWAGCMAAAGHPGLLDRLDAPGLVAERAAALDVPAGTPFSEIEERSGTELAEVQDFERELALLDVGCLESSGFYAAWDEARTELHATFLDTYAADLEAWATWAEEARAGVS